MQVSQWNVPEQPRVAPILSALTEHSQKRMCSTDVRASVGDSEVHGARSLPGRRWGKGGEGSRGGKKETTQDSQTRCHGLMG